MNRINDLVEAVKARIELEGADVNNTESALKALDSTVAPEFCKRIYLKYIASQASTKAE